MPLERGSSDAYWQREARAARLAGEIESSLQYRRRVSLENDEGRDEEEKFSAVVRETEDRGGQRLSSDDSVGCCYIMFYVIDSIYLTKIKPKEKKS